MRVRSLLQSKIGFDWLSSRLQRFPTIWKFAVRTYEFFQFNPYKQIYVRRFSSFSQNPERVKYAIVFDAQCLQTPTRERGIGRYSQNFISSICKSRPEQLFAAILTTLATDADIEKALCLLEGLDCPNLDILILDPFLEDSKITFIQARKNVRSYLEKIGCRAVVSLSPFEKHDSVISFPSSTTYKQIAVLYDLIPLIYPEDFLFSRYRKSSYLWSLGNLATYKLLLAISMETKKHWDRMPFSKTNTEVIHGGGYIGQIQQGKSFHGRFGILCVSAEQPHKNLARLIKSYSLLPKHIQLEHPLIIVGIRSIGAKRKFMKLSNETFGKVIFTEYIDKDEMLEKYRSARLLVMPSIIEGLSLPILEAWSNGLVAIGSKGTAAEELISNDLLLFDPFNSTEISNCMELLLTSETQWKEALKASMLSAAHLTWDATAILALNAIESLIDE